MSVARHPKSRELVNAPLNEVMEFYKCRDAHLKAI